jgi:spore maturation protein CgeB
VAVSSIRSEGAVVVNVNHDDFFGANPNNWSITQRAALASYDLILTTRRVNVEEVRPINPRVEFFPFAYYPRIHRIVEVPSSELAAWESDVVFVGTWESDRAAQMEDLVRRVPARYSVWGAQWEKLSRRSPLRPYVHGKPLFLDDMAKALGSSKVALAFLRKANRDEYTQRTFEIPACGGVLVAERTPEHLHLYEESVEAEFFDSGDREELASKVARLLQDRRKREAMRVAGMRRVAMDRHTYQERMRWLLKRFEK